MVVTDDEDIDVVLCYLELLRRKQDWPLERMERVLRRLSLRYVDGMLMTDDDFDALLPERR